MYLVKIEYKLLLFVKINWIIFRSKRIIVISEITLAKGIIGYVSQNILKDFLTEFFMVVEHKTALASYA